MHKTSGRWLLGLALSLLTAVLWGVLKNDYNSWEELFNQTQVPLLVEAGVPEDDIRGLIIFKVYPPKNCAYFQHNTAMIPIIIKG